MGFSGRKPGRRTRAGRLAAIIAVLSLVGAASQVANTPVGAAPVADFVEESYATGLLGITDLAWPPAGIGVALLARFGPSAVATTRG